jgi:hypothetical protein
MANPEFERNRQILLEMSQWWQSDRNRLMAIRILAYGLFFCSIGGTVYAGIKGALPLWAVTLYVFFAIQLVFLTFMYAIQHSGRTEIRRAMFDHRLRRQQQWEFERGMLAEFTRLTACLSAGISPTPSVIRPKRGGLIVQKLPLPAVENKNAEVRALIRQAIEPHLVETSEGTSSDDASRSRMAAGQKRIDLEFIAYSSETLIELSREMTDELDDMLAFATGNINDVDFHVRILIRSTSPDHEWLIPLARHEHSDEEYAADLRTRFRNVQRSELKRFEETLKNLTSPGQVHFLVRGYWTEPLVKGLMVNNTQGLFGIYTISSLQDPPGWDYSGHDIDFCRADANGTEFERAAATSFNEWFNLLWDEHNSSPVER